MNIFIGGAWPYANGSLHLGHIASLLPGDILARYFRLKGCNVLYVSGSDCNGTPIALRANDEKVAPEVIANRYHKEFNNCFNKLGFSYDCYTRTDSEHHHMIVQQIFLELLNNGFIYQKEIEQTYCEACSQFLPDRYVEGICPACSQPARGDQCDYCSTILDPLELLERQCKICGSTPITKKTEQFYLSLSAFQTKLEDYVLHAEKNQLWRENALQLTKRYLKEGIHDRAVSRDLPIGVNIPISGYEDKKIYVWIEAVAGYFSASRRWAKTNNHTDSEFWNGETTAYYVHGKDNIPFHTIIWPAILMGINKKSLPTHIVSNEYLTLEKKKLSTSRNWAVWIPEILKKYDPDSIRYFLTMNAAENKDTDFSWREFIYSHNSELLGAFGNLVNRTLKFIEKYYDRHIPVGRIEKNIQEKVKNLYFFVGKQIEKASFKRALEEIFLFIRESNKYFDQHQPWKKIVDERNICDQAIANCVFSIANLSQLLHPFLPFTSSKLKEILKINNIKWEPIFPQSINLENVEPLFERIDINQIDEEIKKLNEQANK
ncbi:methionine--tRNA ligase [Heyndrickxia sporothermodurans]